MDLGIEGLGEATEIGVGGSAIVYRSTQTRLDREVAVKVLTMVDPAFTRRFEREARTLGKLSQKPGIVTVHDTGITTAGQPYLVLELCPSSLQDRLNTHGAMRVNEACELLAKVAEAVGEAHDLGVVHRDLKPGNILISPEGQPLVTDFGIATVGGSTMGQTNSVGFTPGYVAPETVEGGSPGPPADVYALGASLFYMVSGGLPFGDTTGEQNLLAMASRVVKEPVPNLRPQGIPDSVCQIIESAMAKDPMRRPTAHQLKQRLEAVARSGAPSPPIDSRPAPPSAPLAPYGLAPHKPPPPSLDPVTPSPSFRPTNSPYPAQPNSRQPQQAGTPPPFQSGPGPGYQSGPITPYPQRATPPQPPTPPPQSHTPPPQSYTPQPQVHTPPPQSHTPPPQSFAPTPQPFRAGPNNQGPGPNTVNRRAQVQANKAAYRAAKRKKKSNRGLRGFIYAILRGVIAATAIFLLGLCLFFFGLYQNTGGIEYSDSVDITDQAGTIGVIGVVLYGFGPFVAFVAGIIWLPWPRRWA